MPNVTLPVPLFLASGGLCLLAGYLIGVVAGPDAPERTIGVVSSYDRGTGRLCLTGDEVADAEGADDEGVLCGRLRRSLSSAVPSAGDSFRFVWVRGEEPPEGSSGDPVAGALIYGDVVD
ncbi:MAG: hypothetical protein ACR2JD_09110 [Nocardioides sp.]